MQKLNGLSAVVFAGENLSDDVEGRKLYVKNVRDSMTSIYDSLGILPSLVKPKIKRSSPHSVSAFFESRSNILYVILSPQKVLSNQNEIETFLESIYH